MILGEERDIGESGEPLGRTTLDDLFRRALLRRPDALALADAPNRQSFADGAPRRLTFAEADRAISAIAARLRRMGLATDTIVAIQLPNTVDGIVTLLGVLRAGMIPMPIPLLWRRAEAVAALGRVGAKVLITSGRVGEVDYGHFALHLAAELFPIRYVCGFGNALPDGIVPLDDLYALDDSVAPVERLGNPAAHVALITWDVTPEGLVPVARSHRELLAGGVATMLEAGVKQDSVILAALMPSSFAGVALTVMLWLLAGGTLALHHPFDPVAFAAQRHQFRCSTAVLPGPVVGRLAEAGLLVPGDGLDTVLGLWRAPERLATSTAWGQPDITLVDVHSFGEVGLVSARRDAAGKPSPVRFGTVSVPLGAADGVPIMEIARTVGGTVALRGPMIPRQPFPPDAERDGLPFFKTVAGGFADTGYPCRVEGEHTMVVTGPPAGLVSVGGYRFASQELHDVVARAGGRLAPLPDSLCGQRLAGAAEDFDALQKALAEIGINALVLDAFREKPAKTSAVSAA